MEGQLWHPKRDDAKVVEQSEPVMNVGSTAPMIRREGQLLHPVSGDDAKVVGKSERRFKREDIFEAEVGLAAPMIRRDRQLLHLVSEDDAKSEQRIIREGTKVKLESAAPMIRREVLPDKSGAPMIRREGLPEKSGVNEQCIYVVPPKVRKVNPEAYTPQVVSIGPFHHPHRSGEGENFLKPMEELKLEYLEEFLNRTGLRAEDFDLKLKEWENRIQSCYAGHVNYNSDHFLKMILIDACFIIEHFLRCHESEKWKDSDPILLKPWLEIDIKCDLILLENQLPFFVLEEIYNLTGMNIKFPSFLDITFDYFKDENFPNMNPEGVCPKHFTDLLRTSMLSLDYELIRIGGVIEHLYSATQLSEAGLVFKASPKGKSLLDLEFHKGELTMPSFHVYDSTTEIYIRNILAFEVCHLPQKQYISEYLKILDFLINTEKDVNILVDKKIIVNLMGDANEVATMVNNLCKNIPMPYFSSKNFTLCKSLNGFYEHPCNKYKAIFIHEYFNTPWKIASTIAAVLLLLLTLIQTICSVISLA